MAGLPGIVVRVTADTASAVSDIRGFNKALGSQTSGLQKFEQGLNRLTPAAAVGFGAVVAGATLAGKAAIEQEDAVGALTSVYGENSKEMLRNAEAASQLGISTATYASEAAILGATLQNLGVSQADSAAQADTLINQASALAAQFGGSTTDAVNAMGAALRGEYDSLEQFGISLTAASVNAKVAEMGMDGLTGAALKEAQAIAAQTLITEQSANATGNFAEQQESAAFKTQQAQAEITNAAAAFGEALLPAISATMDALVPFAAWATENPGLMQGVAAAIAITTGAILALNAGLKIARAAMVAWKAILVVVKVAQLAYATAGFLMGVAGWAALGPIGLIVLAIAALIAIIIVVVKNWDKILAVMKKVASWIKGVFIAAWNGLSNGISRVVGWLRSVYDWIKKILRSGVSKITSMFGGRSLNATVSTVPGVTAVTATGTAARATTQVRTVVVQAPLADPDGTARVLRQVERGANRRGYVYTPSVAL